MGVREREMPEMVKGEGDIENKHKDRGGKEDNEE